jgi:hypothetical protein
MAVVVAVVLQTYVEFTEAAAVLADIQETAVQDLLQVVNQELLEEAVLAVAVQQQLVDVLPPEQVVVAVLAYLA